MAGRYEAQEGGEPCQGNRRPGEPLEACERFQRAAGATREEKLHACAGCPLAQGGLETACAGREAEEMVDRVERLARERDSGRGVFHACTPLEWELLLVWDEAVDERRRGHEARLAHMHTMLVGMLTPRA